jgi:hypothetical protein
MNKLILRGRLVLAALVTPSQEPIHYQAIIPLRERIGQTGHQCYIRNKIKIFSSRLMPFSKASSWSPFIMATSLRALSLDNNARNFPFFTLAVVVVVDRRDCPSKAAT